jgi:hypothetical protein
MVPSSSQGEATGKSQYSPGSPTRGTRGTELVLIKLGTNRYKKSIPHQCNNCITESNPVVMLDLRFHQLLSKVR